jgi:quercetin dioxygenase-like cupin family protein
MGCVSGSRCLHGILGWRNDHGVYGHPAGRERPSNDPTIAVATYDAGTKLDWHVHPGGPVLLITEGTGYYQERGKPVQIVHKGDVIKCLAGVEHWHGAAPKSSFAYIAVTPTQKGKTIWLEPVSDKDYNSAK